MPDCLSRAAAALERGVAVGPVRVQVYPVTGWGPSVAVWFGRACWTRYVRRLPQW